MKRIIKRIIKANIEIQIGDKIHHQVQDITPHNLSTIKAIVSREQKDAPLLTETIGL